MRFPTLYLSILALFTPIAKAAGVLFQGNFPISSANVTVTFNGDFALVKGTYIFDSSKWTNNAFEAIIPIFIHESSLYDKYDDMYNVELTGNFLGSNFKARYRGLTDTESALEKGLPKKVKLIFASYTLITNNTSGHLILNFRYRQPLQNGVFYYLPLFKNVWESIDTIPSIEDSRMQMRLNAELAYDVNLHGTSMNAIWSSGSALVFLRHRSLIVASQIKQPLGIDHSAPFFEIIDNSRLCAIHHTNLIAQSFNLEGKKQITNNLNTEFYKDCPNSITDQAIVDYFKTKKRIANFEICPICQNLSIEQKHDFEKHINSVGTK